MYGKQCPALSVDRNQSLAGVVAAIVAGCQDGNLRLDLVEVFEDAKEDPLGLGSVLYFPFIEWEPVEEGEEEDEEENG